VTRRTSSIVVMPCIALTRPSSNIARASGMRTMFEDGLVKAMQGITTIEEVLRVTEEG